MQFIYFGSFHLSANILERIIAGGFMPTAVICSPDKPAGRKKILTAPAIKQLILAKKWPIKILQPESVSALSSKLLALSSDLFLVMGYPQIIPQSILNIPRLGTIGVHPSLLPKYRGPSPIQSVLLAGETETGVTLYLIDEKMDHGMIIANGKWKIENGTNNAELEKQLTEVAANLVMETLPKIETIKAKEQNHADATFTKKFTSADGQVDFIKDNPLTVYRKIKAFNPEPGVWTMSFPGHEGKRVKLLAADWRQHPEQSEGSSPLHITSIQVDGKKPVRIQ